jgi:hypothetical protein
MGESVKAGSVVDRRTFLKLGAAGALVASHPAEALAGDRSRDSSNDSSDKRRLECPPSLSAMAADRLTYQFRDLFNCPAAMNELGYVQVGKSVSAITAISCPPYVCCGMPETAWSPGYLLTCELFLNGRFLAIAAPPDGNVDYQWFPHCVVRGQTADRLRFTTKLFMPSKRRAVAQLIEIKNLESERRKFTLAFDMRAAVKKKLRRGS